MGAESTVEINELQVCRQLPFKYNIGQPKFVEDDSEIVMHLLARSTTENESAPDEAVESVPDAAGKLAPKEGSESMPEKSDESAPDEASESMADDTGESETDSLWVGIIWNRRVEYSAVRLSARSFAPLTRMLACFACALCCGHSFALSLAPELMNVLEMNVSISFSLNP